MVSPIWFEADAPSVSAMLTSAGPGSFQHVADDLRGMSVKRLCGARIQSDVYLGSTGPAADSAWPMNPNRFTRSSAVSIGVPVVLPSYVPASGNTPPSRLGVLAFDPLGFVQNHHVEPHCVSAIMAASRVTIS